MLTLLDNIVWHALNGAQAALAQGTDSARRYAAGVTALIGFAEPQRPDFAALAPFCAAGERFYCIGWDGKAPPGWHVEVESTIVKMYWDTALPDDTAAFRPLPLGASHLAAAQALAERTHPGPFGPRTFELGEYVGCVEDGRLLAMAGERLHAATLREISAVCTHPDHQGRGLARALMHHLLRRQLQRGEQPFLHVLHDNPARRLYRQMGFREYSAPRVRIVVRD